MKPFDWERLFKEQRITYITKGANVKRGEIAVQCPFCGTADPSQHMGISLDTGWWSCWRNRAMHSGKSPLRLIMRLLRVPYGRAREIAGLGDDYVDPEGFDAVAARLLGRDKDLRPEQTERRFLALDPDFKPITDAIKTRRAQNYLYDRGFNGRGDAGDDVNLLCKAYGLHTAYRGFWQDRIIIPYYQDGMLVTWTARAVANATIRYRDLSLDESILGPKETLFNFDCIEGGGNTLVIVEGPMDALKLDFYGRPLGVRSVALSTNTVKDAQAFLLQAAVDKFKRVVIMLDNATGLGIMDSMRMKQALYFLGNIAISPVPAGRKDAGDLLPNEAIAWARQQYKELS